MYNKWFYLDLPIWNNAFSFDKRVNKKLFITSLKKISILDEIKLWEKIVFEDFDFDWKLSSNFWLDNFYNFSWNNKEVYLFDNHNHAFYFWYEARKKWIIWDDNILVHIDEHSDMKDDLEYLLKPESEDLEKVFEFTNYKLNVGNYIFPAKKEWIIWEVIQIRNETNLNYYLNKKYNLNWKIILNLDLDFFGEGLDYIDYELKKKVILDIAKKASLITVASSPFFVDQKLALKVFRDLFG